jgi:peptidoglycan/xylan/chitin deacetylase (PgdA/CDA1 family)
MLRSIGKTCLSSAYTISPAGWLFSRFACGAARMPFIVGYHRVVENFDRSARSAIPSMLTSTAMLEEHIDWLGKRFTIVSLDEIALHLEADRPFRRRAAAITFDDGYMDVYLHAFPLLKRKGVPAAVFVVTDLPGTLRAQVFDRLYLLLRSLQARGVALARAVENAVRSLGLGRITVTGDRPAADEPFRIMTLLLNAIPRQDLETLISTLGQDVALDGTILEELAPLTWDMIETMQRNCITIGSHTKSHALLTSETLENAVAELAKSKQALESRLRTRIHHFAYPDGRFNRAVVEAVKSTGYRFGYGICPRRDPVHPQLTIPRKILWERACLNAWGKFSPSIMTCHAAGAFDGANRCGHNHA